MADSKGDIDLVEQTHLLDRAIWRKWNKFTWSGILLIVLGLACIGVALTLNLGPYSIAGLIAGVGVIMAITGIIRLLIGLINPLTPKDTRVAEEDEEEQREIL